MPRILSVQPGVLDKTYGGGKRTYPLTKALLNAGYEVHLLFNAKAEDAERLAELEREGFVCHPMYSLLSRTPSLSAANRKQAALHKTARRVRNFVTHRTRVVNGLVHPVPQFARFDCVRPLQAGAKALLRDVSFDLVIIEVELCALVADAIPRGISLILNTQNVPSGMAKRGYETGRDEAKNWLWDLNERAQIKKLARLESKIMWRYDAVVAVSEVDARQFRARAAPNRAERVVVIENGTDIPARESLKPAPCAQRALFTGQMSYGPNMDGMRWFLSDIWPAVLSACPSAHLDIVGVNPSPELYALAGRWEGSVCVTGRVPSVQPYFENADVFVAPLRLGGGTRLKILEAAAMQRPIVATTMAAEGLDALRDGEHLLLRDTSRAFAQAVIGLMKAPETGACLARAARAAAEQHYDWNMLGDRFVRLAERVAGTSERVPAPD